MPFVGIIGGSTPVAAPGSATYSTPGAWSHVVPNYSTSLDIELWGPAGEGGSAGSRGSDFPAPAGQNGNVDTTCTQNTMIAARGGGGLGGGSSSLAPGNGGTAGAASGGTTNTSGTPGSPGAGISGGAGGATPNAGGSGGGGGQDPLGDGGGGGGGGGGGYCKRSFSAGALAAGSTLSGVIGRGGGQTTNSFRKGSNGKVKITWS